MTPKPKHLNPNYAAQFKDESIVAAYQYRPPYPDEVFAILTGLINQKPAHVLDVGCGTGNIARPLARLVDKVDAVDFSRYMIEEGKMLPGGDADNLNWIHGPVEEAPLSPPYALVTAGQSLHWMAWDFVLPRFHSLLGPGGFLAIIELSFSTVPWAEELNQLIARYSTNRDFQPYHLVAELGKRGLFTPVGEQQTAPQPFQQTINTYVESFHSRNGFSRQRMALDVADAFDTAVHALVSHCHPEGVFEMQINGHVTWGLPTQ